MCAMAGSHVAGVAWCGDAEHRALDGDGIGRWRSLVTPSFVLAAGRRVVYVRACEARLALLSRMI
jgi:hypothetical protein